MLIPSIGDAMTFPNRKYMIDDLIKHHPLNGKTYKEIETLLGRPQGDNNNYEIFYDVDVDYGHDIDPVYVKTLDIELSKDSIVENATVNTWRK